MPKNPLKLKRWLIHGVVLSIPLVVTLVVLVVVLEFILGMLSPVVAAVEYLWTDELPTALVEVTTLLSLVAFFLVVGLVADLTPGGYVTRVVDRTMATIPGVSTVYTAMRRATDILVSDDAHQFQDVKLIEFPHQDAYMLSFLIEETPPVISEGLDADEMLTLMMPLGPNPTTNGFIVHMPTEHVHDVDLSVEEAVQSIATLGVAEEGMDDESASTEDAARAR
jgi:uncharacterized membrane protein